MDPVDLEYFKEKLIDMKNGLLTESSVTLHEMQSESTLFPDPNDRASLETDRNTVLRIRDRERKLLTKVQEALDRIDNETFGLCENCEEEIGRKRLDIRPVTTFCINCKAELEAAEKD
ncbi:MAG: RNA polymerase-binding protein DksA [SAR324 cluster bacterium]|nr:RNA polymerase-binding protein DksA [SAR324 cluster bacterium]